MNELLTSGAARRKFESLLRSARLMDRVRLKRDWNRLVPRDSAADAVLDGTVGAGVRRLLERSAAAAERSLVPDAERMTLDYPAELPISARRDEIIAAIRANPVVIVAGATGSGKTTQLPKMALAAGCGRSGRIGCTQPRRLAASSLAHRAATEMKVEFGSQVGYKVRFDDHTSDNTVVKFMTDGILLAETRDDPELLQYDCLMLDEVHERSLNIDFLLGYLKRLLARRKNLKVIISSATLESSRFAEFFNDAPFIEVEGRTFPIEDYYMEPLKDEELSEHIARGVTFLTDLDPRGDILVFLPGEREIRDANELLTGRHLARTEILPLFGRLSAGEQNRIFTPGRQRRIVLATNVAETSLTIPGIRFVIDSGLVRLSRYNPRTRIQELRVEGIAKASMRQRRGRCGRLADGVCVHLYSEDTAREAPDYTDPEIKRSALAGVILQMASLRLGKIEDFPLVDPPAPALVREGYRALNDLGALAPDGRLTPCGWTLAALPLDPHLGKMLEAGMERKVLAQVVVIAAFLSIPDPRERPFEKTQAADNAHRRWTSEKSDFAAALNLYAEIDKIYGERSSNSALRRFAVQNFLNYRRLREWRNLVDDLSGIAVDREWSGALGEPGQLLEYDYDKLHMALLAGLPRQLGCFDREQKNFYDMAGKRFKIFPGSGLARRKTPPLWLMSFALVETSQVFARCCAEAKPEWLMSVAPWLCTPVYDQPHYEPQSGFVYARERLTAGRLLIHAGRQRHYGPVNPAEARSIFIRDALVAGALEEHQARGVPWLEKYLARLRELRKFELKVRRPEMLFDENALSSFFTEKLPENAYSLTALKDHWKRFHTSFLPPDELAVQEGAERWLQPEDYPDEKVFSGVKFQLEYRFAPGEAHDGVALLAGEDTLNLLPPWALDALVPGFLPEKLEFWLRSLPKSDRQKIQPLTEYISDFMGRLKSGELFGERELSGMVADDLAKNRGVTVNGDAFDAVRLPEYLQMKLLVLDDEGNVLETLRSVPHVNRIGSQVSVALPGVEAFHSESVRQWPPVPALPDSIRLNTASDEPAYPALVAGGDAGVGVEVFLKEAEARYRHDDGLCALMKIQLGGLLGSIRKDLKVSPQLEKTWFKRPGFQNARNWRDDLLDAAIRLALGDAGARWKIRTKAAFDTAREAARCKLSRNADELLSLLNGLFNTHEAVRALLSRVPGGCYGATDVKRQLEFLFREGFLRHDAWHERYGRYLRGVELRMQRMIADYRRDAGKGEALEGYLERLYLALDSCPVLQLSPLLDEFWLLLEEARLSTYASEVRTLVKVSPAILRERWEHLRY